MKELNFTFTLDDTNLILDALGRLPFTQVNTLITKIHQQAVSQLGDSAAKSAMLHAVPAEEKEPGGEPSP